jgi:hypothetical protein
MPKTGATPSMPTAEASTTQSRAAAGWAAQRPNISTSASSPCSRQLPCLRWALATSRVSRTISMIVATKQSRLSSKSS